MEQFETVNIIRKLIKHNPEVFISKVTLHNIVLNLLKWADSLRSSLSKNALIALKEICENLGKIVDGEISDILKVFLKKASDTNSFIAETAGEGLNALYTNCNESKVLFHLLTTAETTKNPAIKAKTRYCIGKIIEKAKTGITKMNDINKAIVFITDFMSDASLEVRLSAKKAFELLIEQTNENFLDFLSSLNLKEAAFRKVKDAIKRKTKLLTVSLSKKDLKVVLPSISSKILTKGKKNFSASARELITKNKTEEDFEIIEK